MVAGQQLVRLGVPVQCEHIYIEGGEEIFGNLLNLLFNAL